MKTYVRAVVKDRFGRVIKDTGWKKTNTITRWFYALLDTHMRQSGYYEITFESGDANTANLDTKNWGAVGPEGNTGEHIVVGTGTTSPTRTDYKLESKIPHGTGTGQLIYKAGETIIGDDYIELRRTFENQSGNDITINEVGILVHCVAADGVDKRVLIARSLFTLTIPNTALATIYYRISG